MIIIQPWFTAIGHPAQSTVNTARALGRRNDVVYLLSRNPARPGFDELARQIAACGTVVRFSVPDDSLRSGTWRAVLAAARYARSADAPIDVLFLDAHLALLAYAWPLLRVGGGPIRSFAVLELSGPERTIERFGRRLAVRRLLTRYGCRLFLRTSELAAAWRDAFPGIPPTSIDTLPSLEIPDSADLVDPPGAFAAAGRPRLGVLGQIRPGKSLEWLVPLFRGKPDLGTLYVAGTFTNDAHRHALRVLEDHPAFDNRFLSEAEMLDAAKAQDYLLALYDDWDTRMEAATFFLAARAGRPVISYDEGWCGRMIREYSCGVAVPRIPRPEAPFFRALPERASPAYAALVAGMARFRQAHSADARHTEFLSKLHLDPSPGLSGLSHRDLSQ
jgi:hypothetical protein